MATWSLTPAPTDVSYNDTNGDDLSTVFAPAVQCISGANYLYYGLPGSLAIGTFVMVSNNTSSSMSIGTAGFINGKGTAVSLSDTYGFLFLATGIISYQGYTDTNYVYYSSNTSISSEKKTMQLTLATPTKYTVTSYPFSNPITLSTTVSNYDLANIFCPIMNIQYQQNGFSGLPGSGVVAGTFFLLINDSVTSTSFNNSGYAGGSSSSSLSIDAWCASLYLCTGNINGYTNYLYVGADNNGQYIPQLTVSNTNLTPDVGILDSNGSDLSTIFAPVVNFIIYNPSTPTQSLPSPAVAGTFYAVMNNTSGTVALNCDGQICLASSDGGSGSVSLTTNTMYLFLCCGNNTSSGASWFLIYSVTQF